MSLTPYVYIPDDSFDLGEAGEHSIEVLAWIQPAEPGYLANVNIVRAVVKVAYKDFPTQELNVTPHFKKYAATLRRWEDAIRKDWEEVNARERNDGGGDAA